MVEVEQKQGTHEGHEVKITINGKHFEIRRGPESVATIKAIGHVPLADDLEQKVRGRLVLLPDDGTVQIHGGEVFVSHPKDSGSS